MNYITENYLVRDDNAIKILGHGILIGIHDIIGLRINVILLKTALIVARTGKIFRWVKPLNGQIDGYVASMITSLRTLVTKSEHSDLVSTYLRSCCRATEKIGPNTPYDTIVRCETRRATSGSRARLPAHRHPKKQ